MDWDRDRDRSFRLDESRRRESYRPVDRPNRSPFRNRSPPRQADSWVPSNGRPPGRPRSRSPPSLRRSSRSPGFRGRDTGAGFPRARSPPRRFSPRREERQRSPSRSRRSRSPYGHPALRSPRQPRARSPPLKRGRESPAAYNARSPKRERIASPPRVRYDKPQSPPSGPRQMSYGLHRGGYHLSSRVPARRDPPKDPYENSWRRRSPSNVRSIRGDHNSGQAHAITPRRSPPPARPQRFDSSHSVPKSRSPTQESLRQNEPLGRSPKPGVKSPAGVSERYPSHSLPSQSTQHGRVSHRSPSTRHATPTNQPQRERSSVQHDQSQLASTQGTTNGNQPAIPTISSSPQMLSKPVAASTPTGPSAAPISVSGAQRAAHLSLLSAPTRPKGGQAFKRDSPRESSTSNISRRGPPPIHNNPPTGPRSSFSPVAANHDQHRSRHPTGGTNPLPRTQRSTTNHLSGVTALVPGGKLLISSLDPTAEKRLAQLEVDKEKLLEQIVEKQKVKRAGLRDWDRLERESAIGALRSELADGHLQRMVEGDSIGGGVAF